MDRLFYEIYLLTVFLFLQLRFQDEMLTAATILALSCQGWYSCHSFFNCLQPHVRACVSHNIINIHSICPIWVSYARTPQSSNPNPEVAVQIEDSEY